MIPELLMYSRLAELGLPRLSCQGRAIMDKMAKGDRTRCNIQFADAAAPAAGSGSRVGLGRDNVVLPMPVNSRYETGKGGLQPKPNLD
jgi:hypothetical protein